MKNRGHSSLLAFAVATSCATSAMAQPARPNILIVLLDDAGFTDIGAYGGVTRTPVIDDLAQRGVKLSRYHTSPFCGPSRAMLLTGMDNHQVGMGTLIEVASPEMRAQPGYSMRFAASQQTIASRLSAVGYRTYVTGKWGIGETGANLPNRFGFDRSYVMDATGGSNYDMTPYLPGYHKVDWFEDGKPITLPKDHYSSRSLVDKMVEYIDGGDPAKPFFAFLSLQAVHIPVQASKANIDAYNGVFDAGWDKMRQQRLQQAIKAGAVGFVPKTLAAKSIVSAVKFMASGEVFAPFGFMHREEVDGNSAITKRERDVLIGLTAGKSNKEIANDLDLQEVTIKLHVKTLCRKLGAKNRTQAAMIARDRRLL